MQIIPTHASAYDTLLYANTSRQDEDAHKEFLSALQDADREAEKSEKAAENPTIQEQIPVVAAPQVQSPYSRTSSNGVTYTLDEVCFTKQELQNLRQDMAKAGVSEDSLKRLDALADQPDGATLALVMACLRGGSATPLLSDEEKSAITSLLKKLDPTGTLDTGVQVMMAQGKGQEALGLVFDFLGRLNPLDKFELTQDEAIALGKGLGLGTSSLQALADSFGGNAAISCLTGQLSSFLTPMTDYFTSEKAAQKKLDAAMQQTLQPMIAKARARTEKEKQANALHSRKAQQSKVLIDKTVQQKSQDILEQTLHAAQQSERKDGENALKSAAPEHAGDEGKKRAAQAISQAGAAAENAANSKSAVQQGGNTEGRLQAQPATQQAKPLEAGSHESARNNTSQDNKGAAAWGELLHKVEARTAATGERADGIPVYAAMQPTQPVEGGAHSALAAPLSRQVAQQVEQGLLSTLKGGGSRLELQLHPQELGAITITLTVRNGEVSALIRSDKTETADMVNRQLDMIRTNLEQQGLKVDKVEVQLNARQQEDMTWQNLDQHNSWQEEDARREELARLRNLASIRNTTTNSEDTSLEQPVHSLDRTARDATRSLYVVA